MDHSQRGQQLKLHSVFITHNRLHLTKRALESYLETITVPWTVVVVDNASTDGTVEWLQELSDQLIFNLGGREIRPIQFMALTENRYPGFATNQGWGKAPPDATHFQRADNDWEFLPGWCEEVEERFQDPSLGQLGLRTDWEEVTPDGTPHPSNVGGNCVITRRLWKKGLRYSETPWTQYPPGLTEDTFFSPAVEAFGYRWERVKRPCIRGLEAESRNDPYYQRSWGDRRIHGFPL